MITTDPALVAPTDLLDFEHPDVERFVDQAGCFGAAHATEAVRRLHDGVRDDIDYTVFDVPLHPTLAASDVVREGTGFCLHKSLLFVAGCRGLGLPAVLCSDVVTNHVADEAMLTLVGGEEFVHWYARVHVGGRWVKAAPVFNTLLCRIYGIDVLEFDPARDDIAQRNVGDTSMAFRGQQQTYPEPSMHDLLAVIEAAHPLMTASGDRTPTSASVLATARAGGGR